MRVENFILSSALVGSGFAREVDRNIYGKPLEKCDRSLANDPNWPITGFMRGNYCKATEMDRGSHYVCVNLPDALTDEGEHYSTFWTETGQAETPEEATTWPLAGPWCICEWAYARMVYKHSHFKDMLRCGAINQWVIESYRLDVDHQAEGLDTICRTCDVVGQAVNPALANKCRKAMARS